MSKRKARRQIPATIVRTSQAAGVAAVGFAAWSAQSAEASVIYSGAVNAPVNTSTSYNVDFNKDGVTDAQFGTFTSTDQTKPGSYLKLFLQNPGSNDPTPPHAFLLGDNVNNVVANLAPNTPIGASQPDSSTSWTKDDKVLYDSRPGGSTIFGHFPPGTPGYVGLSFVSPTDATQTYYGWAQFETIDGSTGTPSGTLIDYAYESDPNTAIMAGDTGPVPEPGSLALLATGAAGLATYRGRRKRTM